jgi:hypothetical protein
LGSKIRFDSTPSSIKPEFSRITDFIEELGEDCPF